MTDAEVVTYTARVLAFPLQSIRDDAALDAATAVLRDLLQKNLDGGGQAYLDALTDLIAVSEQRTVPVGPAADADLVRLLIDSNRLTQTAFAARVGIAQSTLSQVLRGRRVLTRGQVGAVAAAFNLSPAAFYPPAGAGR